MTRQEMKSRAKTVLGNNIFCEKWMLALLVELIILAINGFISTLSYGVISIIVAGPLAVGEAYCFLKTSRDGMPVKIENMFKGFTSNFGENVVLGLLSSLFIALWSLLFIIPGIIKSYEYSMIFFIKNDHPELDWKGCIEASRQITHGHKMELFVLDLSFIGWYIVGSLCFGIGTLWVLTYHTATRAQFYESIKNEQPVM